MGCSASCALFEKNVNCLEWRLKIDKKWIRLNIFGLLFIGGRIRICDDLGVPLAEKKQRFQHVFWFT